MASAVLATPATLRQQLLVLVVVVVAAVAGLVQPARATCPVGFTEAEESCYLRSATSTYTYDQAKAWCLTQDATSYPPQFTDSAHFTAVRTALINAGMFVGRDRLWSGLIYSGADFEWEGGPLDGVVPTDVKWAAGQPDSSGNCVQMNYKKAMDDVPCSSTKFALCEAGTLETDAPTMAPTQTPTARPTTAQPTVVPTVRVTDAPTTSPTVSPAPTIDNGACDIGFFEWQGYCYQVNHALVGRTEANNTCNSRDGSWLVQFENETEYDALRAFLVNDLGLGEDEVAWTGAYRADANTNFTFQGGPLDGGYTTWKRYAPEQPSGNGHCMQMNYFELLDDVECGRDKAFVCQDYIPTAAPTPSPTSAPTSYTITCPQIDLGRGRKLEEIDFSAATTTYTNEGFVWSRALDSCVYYSPFDVREQWLAKQLCQDNGGYLVQWRNESVANELITEFYFLIDPGDYFWVGGEWDQSVGNFTWTGGPLDGQPLPNSAWHPSDEAQDGSGNCTQVSFRNEWGVDDVPCDNHNPRHIMCAVGGEKEEDDEGLP